jgi:hypothetical protein
MATYRFTLSGIVLLVQAAALLWSSPASADVPERSPTQTLLPEPEENLPAGEGRPNFGSAVAVRGNTALVAMGSHVERGRVARFTREGREWRRTGHLPCPFDDCLFAEVIVMRDNVALVGGYRSIVIFRNEGGVWTHKETIFRPDEGSFGFWHGGRVRYQDGIVVAPSFPSDGGAGVVYAFELDRSLQLARTVRLTPHDSAMGDEFGASVSMARECHKMMNRFHGSEKMRGRPLNYSAQISSLRGYVPRGCLY